MREKTTLMNIITTHIGAFLRKSSNYPRASSRFLIFSRYAIRTRAARRRTRPIATVISRPSRRRPATRKFPGVAPAEAVAFAGFIGQVVCAEVGIALGLQGHAHEVFRPLGTSVIRYQALRSTTQ